MNAGDLIRALEYKNGLSVIDISHELNVSRQAVYGWVNGSEPSDKRHVNILKKMFRENGSDIDLFCDEVREILEEIKKIKAQDWKNLIRGLQEKLNLEQFELLSRIGLKNDFHVSEWISGKRIPVLKKKFKIIELAKSLRIETPDLILSGTNLRNSIKFNNSWISVKDARNINDSDGNLLVLKKGEVLLKTLNLFPKYYNKNPIKFINKDGKILVFYDEKISTRPQPLMLPECLKLDDTFLVGLGIYLGEGSRNRKPKVTNSEPVVINQAIRFFELFSIHRKRLRAWIQLHERSVKNFNEVREFWIRSTDLKEENITGIIIKKSSGNSKVKQYGVLHLEASFILLQLLIQGLMEEVFTIVTKISRNQTIPFLQGAFAAEGSVEAAKSGSVRTVSYTSTRSDERGLIKNLLEKLGIVVHEYKKGFSLRIHGFENLRRLVEIEIFKYHPIRNEKLTVGFRKLENSKKNH